MSIATVINEFEGITLSQMDRVTLMNRTDRKYWFNINHLEELLRNIKDEYYILEINGDRSMPYATTYYDTAENQMYINHHRGKLNRFKIRRRCYVSSNKSFLEVKFKSNKGRTIKNRIPTIYNTTNFNNTEDEFLADNSPYTGDQLHEVLGVGFNRLMLVSREMNERCTIDQQLSFTSNGVEAKLEQLVIVEVKSEGRANSKIINAMRKLRLKPSGFSKYCMGRSITNKGLKSNRFRSKHRQIERHIHTSLKDITTTK